MVANTEATSIELTWSVSSVNCDVLGYEIVMTTDVQEMVIFVEGAATSQYVAMDLRPSSDYIFTLAAVTVLVGNLEPSAPVLAKTLNFTGKSCYII